MHGAVTQQRLSSWEWYQRIVQTLPGIAGRPHRSAPQTPVYDDIRLLGALLGRVVAADRPNGRELFLLIRELRHQIQASRAAGQDTTEADVAKILPKLLSCGSPKAGLEKLLKVVDTFRIFLELASLAESYHQDPLQTHEPPIDEIISQKASEGIPPEQIVQAVEHIHLRLVSTAHPTQIFRTTYLNHHKRILKGLVEFHAAKTFSEQEKVISALETYIQCLWLTGFVQWVKPTVQDEANSLQNYLDSLFQALPKLQVAVTQALQPFRLKERPPLPPRPIVEIGSWVGGDMDGNPNAQPHVLAAILATRRNRILAKYRDNLDELAAFYSFSALKGVTPSAMLVQSIEQDMQAFEAVRGESFEWSQGIYKYQGREPFRQKLLLMAAKLNHTLSYPLTLSLLDAPRFESQFAFLPQPFSQEFVYTNASALMSDLKLLLDGLQCLELSDELLLPLQTCLNAVQIFDFHFAGIDLREEAEHIQAAVRCALMARGYDLTLFPVKRPQNADAEKAWFAFLEQLLTQPAPAPIHPHELTRVAAHWPEQFSEGGAVEKRLLGMTAVMKLAHAEISPDASRHLLLSMTHSASDALAALMLLQCQQIVRYNGVEWLADVDIVPLFETIDDLSAAEKMMTQLFESPPYREYLRARNHRQIVLIAYSDSNKDGGYFTSKWSLYQVQKHLSELAQRYGVTIQYYHGRGGSIGRGGGPSRQHILSLPSQSFKDGIQITEQGEVLARYYLSQVTAQTHLNNLLSASFIRNLNDANNEERHPPEWEEVANALSETAYHKYRALKGLPGFVAYFNDATPREIETIHIGSRPSHRRKIARIEDLRAIPWVFRWFQSRTIIPGWFGLGSALQDYAQRHEKGLETLRTLYQDWLFFRGVLNNSAMGALQTDMPISRHYATLLDESINDASQMQTIFETIQAEYILTRRMLGHVTQCDQLLCEPETITLQQSITMKRTYLDPLNYLQVYLLKQFRSQPHSADDQIQDLYHRAFISSTGGIVAGLGASG